MRDEIKEYEAVAKAAEKFVKSVAEGNSEYAKTLFTDDALLSTKDTPLGACLLLGKTGLWASNCPCINH